MDHSVDKANMEELFQRQGEIKVDDEHLAAVRANAKRRLYRYKAPKWAERLTGKPSSKIDLCQKYTPIQRWCLPDIPDDFEIYIKREDMTGSTLSGHKVRKIEIHLADALEKNCKTLIGFGSTESNNCRVVAVAGKELGFDVHLVQYTEKNKFPLNCNIFLSQMAGAHIHLVQVDNITETMMQEFKLPAHLKPLDQEAYILPITAGGDGDSAIYAYIDTFQELVSQGVTENFTDLVLACGSSLTTAAFIIGNYMTGGKLRLHAMSVRHTKEEYTVTITKLLKKYGFFDIIDSPVNFEDLISIVEKSKEPKYGEFSEEVVEFVRLTAAATGIFLDPIYTAKAAYHMVKMTRTSSSSFKGKKILFYNTGSVYGSLNEDLILSMKRQNGLNAANHTSEAH